MISEWFVRLDNFLLDRVYQPVVDLASRRAGIGFIAIAEFLFIGGMLNWFLGAFALNHGAGAIDIAMTLTLVVMGLFLSFIVYGAVQLTRRELKKGFVNVARYRLLALRISYALQMLFFCMPEPLKDRWHVLHYITSAGYSTLMFAGFYFLSCQPGPPRVRRRKTIHVPANALPQGAI